MGEGPVQATPSPVDGYRLTGTRTQVGLRPGGRRVPGSRRNRFRHSGFPGRRRRPGRHGDRAGDHRLGQRRAPGAGRHRGRRRRARSAAGKSSPGSARYATLGRTAFQLGVLDRGLQMTAEYAREREQFDRPIGSFQAVAQRLADGYIDVKGLRLTLTQAAWKVSEDIPAEIDVASRGVLGRRCRAPGGAHHRARARRRRRRHRSPGAPLFPGRQGNRVRAGRRHRAAAPDRP